MEGMKNRDMAKKILVGSLILLLSIPSAYATVDIKDNQQIPTVCNCGNYSYSLGVLTVIHQTFYNLRFRTQRGSLIEYEPPENTSFQFCEMNGTVMMNFTLTVRHRINMGLLYFILPRYTLIDCAYINYKGQDYFRIFDEHLCNNEVFEEYTINLTPDKQLIPLETNGENVTVQFWLYAGVSAGNFSLPLNDGSTWRFGRSYGHKDITKIDLTIVPIACKDMSPPHISYLPIRQ
jgi:hypothetical protein